MGEEVKVLERVEAIANSTTPTGRKLGVVMEQEYGLYRIGFIDGRSGDLPTRLQSRYTKGELAREEISRYLADMWDMSEKAAVKSSRKAHLEKMAEKEKVTTNAESESAVAA